MKSNKNLFITMEYCFFTPSYFKDLERVQILRNSINRFNNESVNHYIVVPSKDFDLFNTTFKNDKFAIVLKQNDFVIREFYSSKLYSIVNYLFPSQSWRINKISGRPGWIIQQIVKLNIPNIINEDAAIILDSDIFFVKSFSINKLFTQQNFKLLIKRHPLVESGMQREYMFKSRNTLNLPEGSTDYHYMSWPVIWYKDIVLELQNYLNKCYKQNWQKSLYDAVTISEYCLYGIFVEEILKPNDLKIIDEKIYFGIWDQDDFMKFISNDFTDIKNEVCVVIQSNLGMSVHEYKKQVDQFLEKK